MTYTEKLKDPRWQKTRLKVLERDNFTCISCGENTKQLHVHHCYYVSKRDPWEYCHETLVTLCSDCHKSADERESPVNDLCTRFEGAAQAEMERQLSNRKNQVEDDDGAVVAFCRAAFENGWPIPEAMNILRDAAEIGIIDSEWLSALSRQVRKVQKLNGTNQ